MRNLGDYTILSGRTLCARFFFFSWGGYFEGIICVHAIIRNSNTQLLFKNFVISIYLGIKNIRGSRILRGGVYSISISWPLIEEESLFKIKKMTNLE